jgi:aminomethyltransferase
MSTDGEKIGAVTSGGPSPSTKQNIGMGYVKTPFAKSGTKVLVEVRGKMQEAELVKMPFVEAKYYKV